MSLVLGLNAYHGDSAAALLDDGEIVVAVEEERFRRVKHWAGFPTEAIQHCLEVVGVTLAEIDRVAINRDPRANWGQRLAFVARHRPSLGKIIDRLRNRTRVRDLRQELEEAFPNQRFVGEVHYVEHHVAHLASAALVAPFDTSLAVSIDQFGDFASTAWGVAAGPSVEAHGRIFYPHSMGTFYSALTQFLGFPNYGDEYKVMGLAPYGSPTFLPQLRKVVRQLDSGEFRLDLRYFRHYKARVDQEWSGGAPHTAQLYTPKLERLLGPARAKGEALTDAHRDLARSVQALYEEVAFHLLRSLRQRYGVSRLALAGGCAMNSVANGKIREQTGFEKVFIQAAAGDAGGALGAALYVHHQHAPTALRRVMSHAYLGPEYSGAEVEALLQDYEAKLPEGEFVVERHTSEAKLCDQVARAIADGLVVGWFQGRMEWGPRALGNRSIVCDPRRADIREVLNAKIKRRESFRPFAPSVLRDAVPDWFCQDDDVPFMMKVFPIKPEKRDLVPAVTHVDGTGRLQTVDAVSNPRYHRLITTFKELTGIPLVLNTSFNENEPIVCEPREALECFLRTKMDIVVLGNYVVRRDRALTPRLTNEHELFVEVEGTYTE